MPEPAERVTQSIEAGAIGRAAILPFFLKGCLVRPAPFAKKRTNSVPFMCFNNIYNFLRHSYSACAEALTGRKLLNRFCPSRLID